jgi:predicted RNA binding protein YcfA (HicA-like mRNA interferase family)
VADKLPRDIKPEEALKAFEKAGGVRRGGKGSHASVKMPNGQLVTIPCHGTLKVGLLITAIKKAGLTVQQFLDLVGR